MQVFRFFDSKQLKVYRRVEEHGNAQLLTVFCMEVHLLAQHNYLRARNVQTHG